jgi:hypothetical protein
MAWYKTGTITVTNGSTTVTGSGTQWIANAGVGEALYAPDGRLYEITNIASDTSITIAPAYLGTTASAQAYVFVPSQSYIRDLAAQAADLVNNYSTIANNAGVGKFGDGTLAAPGIRFSDDLDTGFFRSASNEVTFVAGGVAQFKYNASGLSISSGTANVTNLAYTGTLTGGTGVVNIGSGQVYKDAGGNVGIGTSSPTSKLHVVGGRTDLSANSEPYALGVRYSSGAGLYYIGATNSATPDLVFSQVGGSERVRFTNDGNVGIGTSSPTFKLDLVGGQASIFNTGATANSTIRYSNTDKNWYVGLRGDTNDVFAIADDTAFRLTVDSSGNVGIGTSSPTYKFQVAPGDNQLAVFNETGTWTANDGLVLADYYSGTTLIGGIKISAATTSSGYLTFHTGGTTERARIDTSGNLLVGITSNVYHTIVKNISGDWSLSVRNTNNSSPFGLNSIFPNASPNGVTNEFLYCADSSAIRMTVRSNGGIANFSGNDANLSDRREKTNFAPAKSYLDVICAIPIQTFNYIDQNHEEDPGLTLGVVAQDVQAVAPELVTESNWGTKEEPKMRLSVYQTDLQYALMKCIQEQQALIQDLTTRLTTLEGN